MLKDPQKNSFSLYVIMIFLKTHIICIVLAVCGHLLQKLPLPHFAGALALTITVTVPLNLQLVYDKKKKKRFGCPFF